MSSCLSRHFFHVLLAGQNLEVATMTTFIFYLYFSFIIPHFVQRQLSDRRQHVQRVYVLSDALSGRLGSGLSQRPLHSTSPNSVESDLWRFSRLHDHASVLLVPGEF